MTRGWYQWGLLERASRFYTQNTVIIPMLEFFGSIPFEQKELPMKYVLLFCDAPGWGGNDLPERPSCFVFDADNDLEAINRGAKHFLDRECDFHRFNSRSFDAFEFVRVYKLSDMIDLKEELPLVQKARDELLEEEAEQHRQNAVRLAEEGEKRDRALYEKLKAKFEPGVSSAIETCPNCTRRPSKSMGCKDTPPTCKRPK